MAACLAPVCVAVLSVQEDEFSGALSFAKVSTCKEASSCHVFKKKYTFQE